MRNKYFLTKLNEYFFDSVILVFSDGVVLVFYDSVVLVFSDRLGSLARTCNVATDRLVYKDVRGLSTTEPCPRAQIWGRIKPIILAHQQALPSTSRWLS